MKATLIICICASLISMVLALPPPIVILQAQFQYHKSASSTPDRQIWIRDAVDTATSKPALFRAFLEYYEASQGLTVGSCQGSPDEFLCSPGTDLSDLNYECQVSLSNGKYDLLECNSE